MKILKPFIAMLVLGIALSSCKKSDDSKPATTTTSSMTFTANGTAVKFNTCLEADISLNNVNEVVIAGTNITNGKAAASSFTITIMQDPATLKAGQTFAVSSSGTTSLAYYVTDSETDQTQVVNPQGTVTITDVSSTVIKGTFSAKLFDAGDFEGQTVTYTITSGTFTAQRPS